MLRVSPGPSHNEVNAFINRAINKDLIAAEINHLENVFDLLNIPAVQRSLSAYAESRIVALRLRYKSLVTMVKTPKSNSLLVQFRFFADQERCFTYLKHLRRTAEQLVNKILLKPKSYLRLDVVCIDVQALGDIFSVTQVRQQKQVLMKICQQLGHSKKINPALLAFSETILWMNDQNQFCKLSNLALLLINRIQACFHQVSNRYYQCLNENSRFAVVSEMESLALFLISLEQGIRRYPQWYRCMQNESREAYSNQVGTALIIRPSSE